MFYDFSGLIKGLFLHSDQLDRGSSHKVFRAPAHQTDQSANSSFNKCPSFRAQTESSRPKWPSRHATEFEGLGFKAQGKEIIRIIMTIIINK